MFFYKSRFLCWRRYNDSGLWCTMMGWMAAHNSGRQLTTINIMQLSLEVVVDRTISCTLILSLSLSLPLSHTYILYCHSIILHPLPLFMFTHKKRDGRLSKFSLKSMNFISTWLWPLAKGHPSLASSHIICKLLPVNNINPPPPHSLS